MKLITILFSCIISVQAFATPTTTETEEIGLDDIQAELMSEIDTLVVDEDDELFLDEEIEKKVEITVQNKKSQPEVKKTVQAPTETTTKK